MKLILYKSVSRSDRVDKTDFLQNPKTYTNITFKTSEDTNDLIITLNDLDALNYNYAYIEELNRYYYFVDKPRVLNNNLVEITLHCDLLMTNKDTLLEQECIIARQENVYDAYLNDTNIQIESYERIQTKLFPQGFTNQNASFILVVAGKQ